MLTEVKAWQASDGTIFKFENKQGAINYENRLIAMGSVDENYQRHKSEIIDYISSLIGKQITEDEVGYDSDGWDCDEENNPIGKCIYNADYDYECCVYCDGPEERK